MEENELCFVWGAPLSGQKCWMARAAGDSDLQTRATIVSLDASGESAQLDEILDRLGPLLKSKVGPEKAHHIYCELPWSAIDDGLSLEDWLANREEFKGPQPQWRVSFVCLCPKNADRLPETYRIGLEEFSRATQSAVIVIKIEGDEESPLWLSSKTIDFGRNLEIYEENLWPRPALDPIMEESLEFTELEFMTLPFAAEPATHHELFRGLERGDFGTIWGAELYWKNREGQFEAMTLSQGRIFDWTSNQLSLVDSTVANGALLNIAGEKLKKKELLENLRSQFFC